MKCKFCQARIKKGLSICPECGMSLKEELPAEETAEEITAKTAEEATEETAAETTEETAAETAEKTAEEKTPKPKKNRKGTKIALATTGLALLAVILTGAVLHFTGVINVVKWFSKQDVFYKANYTAALDKVEKNGEKVVARVGNQKLTVSELQVHYWEAVMRYVKDYGAYIKVMGLDPEKSLGVQVYDKETGKTYQQWFLENAIESWRRYATLAQMAEDAKFQLTPEQQNELNNMPETIKKQALEEGFADVEAYVDKYYPGGSLQGFVNYNAIILKAMCYYDVLYDSIIPSQAEIDAYYAQNEVYFREYNIAKENGLYYDVRHIFIPVEGEIGDIQGTPSHTDEEWAQCKPKAEKVLNDFLASGGGEAAFAQLAKEISADTKSAQNGGLYEKLTKDTSFVETFKAWYLDENRKPGDTGIVKNDKSSKHGYHVMYFCDSYAIWEYETKNAVLAEKTEAMLQEAAEKWPITVKYSKILLGEPEVPETTETTAPSK